MYHNSAQHKGVQIITVRENAWHQENKNQILSHSLCVSEKSNDKINVYRKIFDVLKYCRKEGRTDHLWLKIAFGFES